mgnify:CR=1 FL=1
MLLQITAICSVIVHEMLDSSLNLNSMYSMVVVLIGGFLTAGGANAINMWYDGDIDREMKRTENRPIPRGVVSERSALLFGVFISIVGVAWFLVLSNEVAAFWASFSILFYVIIYSFWLKRRTSPALISIQSTSSSIRRKSSSLLRPAYWSNSSCNSRSASGGRRYIALVL